MRAALMTFFMRCVLSLMACRRSTEPSRNGMTRPLGPPRKFQNKHRDVNQYEGAPQPLEGDAAYVVAIAANRPRATVVGRGCAPYVVWLALAASLAFRYAARNS